MLDRHRLLPVGLALGLAAGAAANMPAVLLLGERASVARVAQSLELVVASAAATMSISVTDPRGRQTRAISAIALAGSSM